MIFEGEREIVNRDGVVQRVKGGQSDFLIVTTVTAQDTRKIKIGAKRRLAIAVNKQDVLNRHDYLKLFGRSD